MQPGQWTDNRRLNNFQKSGVWTCKILSGQLKISIKNIQILAFLTNLDFFQSICGVWTGTECQLFEIIPSSQIIVMTTLQQRFTSASAQHCAFCLRMRYFHFNIPILSTLNIFRIVCTDNSPHCDIKSVGKSEGK